jgi:phage-related protein
MAKDDVTIGIGVDSTKAIKSLKGFGKSSKSVLKSITDSVFSLKGAFAGVAAGLAAGALIKGIKTVTSAASRQEDAINSLNTALKISGEFSEGASKGLQDYASSLQRATRFGDEAILEQLALAKAFGATNEQAKQLVTAATELSAATGKSLEESTRQLSKTLGGFAGELGEVNPKIKALTTAQLQAGDAAKILIDQYGGSAAAQINTFSGALEQSSNAFGDLLESLGATIIQNPSVVRAIKALTAGFEFLIEQVELNKDAIGEVVTQITDGLISAFDLAVASVKQAVFFFKEYQTIITGLPRLIFQTTAAILALNGAITLYSAVKGLGALASLKDFGAAIVLLGSAAKKAVIAVGLLAGKALLMATGVAAAAIAVDLLVRNLGLVGPAIAQAFNLQKITSLNKEIAATEKAIKEIHSQGVSGIPTNSLLGFKVVQNADALKTELQEMKSELVVLSGEAQKSGDSLREAFDSGFIGDLIDKFNDFKKEVAEPVTVELKTKGDKPKPKVAEEVETDLKKSFIAGGVILANGLKKGAEGAKDVIIGGVGLLVDTLFPGFGALASSILDLLSDPKAISGLVAAFASELPKILVAIADSIPLLIEAIIENLDEIIIGIVKAVPAIIKALIKAIVVLTNPAIWADVAKGLVQALVQEITGTTLVFSKAKTKDIGDGIAQDFKKGVSNFSIPAIISGGEQFGQSISRNLDGVGQRLNQGLLEVFDLFTITFAESLTQGLISLPERIADGALMFADTISGVFTGFFSGLENFLGSFGAIFNQILASLGMDIGAAFVSGTRSFADGIRSAFIDIINLFIKHLVDPILSLPNRMIEAFNGIIERMRSAVTPGGGSVGSKVSDSFKNVVGLAQGGTVPSGFNNDSFAANLTSGELVVPRNDVQELRTFLREQKRAGGDLDMSETNSLLAKIAGQGGQGGGMITLNEDGLTNLLLDFSRRNERISA